jgi:hypothetical protein
MSDIQDLSSDLMGGGLPVAIFAGAILVTFLIGFFSTGGALFVLALGLLAAVAADVFAAKPAEGEASSPQRQLTSG